MIAHLRGKLVDKQPNLVIIDVGGVGYAVTIPVSTYSQLGQTGAEASLHIHTHVREDALALFGFATRGEKAIFEQRTDFLLNPLAFARQATGLFVF